VFDQHLAPSEAESVRFWHALPVGWENLSYDEFLERRRELVAKVVRAGFEKLVSGADPFTSTTLLPSAAELIEQGESPLDGGGRRTGYAFDGQPDLRPED